MPVTNLVGAPVTGRFKPSLAHQVLRACPDPDCRHTHPLAMKPVPLDTDHCPGCGGEIAPPEAPVDVPAIGGWIQLWIGLANAHHWLAEQLLRLAKRI